jgi:ABC-type phosphate/phosphonate transport system substrate-binding protein
VGATYAVFEHGDATQKLERAGFVDVVPGKRARILYAAGPIPSDPIVVAPTIGPRLRAELIHTLTTISEAEQHVRDAVIHIIGADTFEAVRPHSFDGLRDQIAHGRELGLLDHSIR